MNNIILLLNDFPKLSVFDTIDIIKGNDTSGNPQPHRSESLTTSHISINSKILTRLFVSTQMAEGHLNKLTMFNNVVVILDGVITNKRDLIENSGVNITSSFTDFMGPQPMRIEIVVILLYCRYGFKETVAMLEGQFSLVLIDRRTDGVIENAMNFRNNRTQTDTKLINDLLDKHSLCVVPQSPLSKSEKSKYEYLRSQYRMREMIRDSELHEQEHENGYGTDSTDIIGSKIYVSREKSGITTMFMIIVANTNNSKESFLVANNYGSVIRIERELTENGYNFTTVKINAGCYAVLMHGHFVFSKWRINHMNHPYYTNPYIEKYIAVQDDYIKTYGALLYDCITDLVDNSLKNEKDVGCLLTNTIETRVIFEKLKKYYSMNSVRNKFYVYTVSFEDSLILNMPELYSEHEEKNAFIHTKITIPSVYSIDMKLTVKRVINNMIHLYSCEFMEEFLNDRIIQKIIANNDNCSVVETKFSNTADTDNIQIEDREYYLNVLKANISYFYLSEHISRNMPTVKTVFLPSGSRFIFNGNTQNPSLFDKNTYNIYCKNYKNSMDSNEGLRINLYLFSRNIRGVCPFSDKRMTDIFFNVSKEIRYSIFKTVGIIGNTLLSFMEHERIMDGSRVNVKTPDEFFVDNKSIYVSCKTQNNNIDDIIY